MKTLQLRNGDLVVAPGGFATLEGAAKVRQDLGAMVREAIGTDRFHPRYGTILENYIGRMQDDETKMLVRAEIQRSLQNYMMMQNEQIQQDMLAGRRPRFSPAEIVVDMSDIDVQFRFDRFNVKVSVSTASGDSVTLLRSVEL